MNRLAMIGLAVVAAVAAAACSGGEGSAASPAVFEAADKYAISELQVKFHEANSTKDLELLMSLFADDAVFTLGGRTFVGKQAIRHFYITTVAPFRPENNWTSLHPAFKVRITVVEDRGTLHFECHYVDRATREFKASVAADGKVARIGDRWLFTGVVGSEATLG